MSITQAQIESWQRNQFLDCSRDDLSNILHTLSAHPGRGAHSEETLRRLCCEAIGIPYAPRAGEELVTNDPPGRVLLRSAMEGKRWFARRPMLICRPGWEGRRRKVRLHIHQDRLKKGTAALLTANNWTIEVQPGHVVSISYPHFEALKNTQVINSSQEEFMTQYGEATFRYQEYPEPTYPFDDLGDDPDTADRPTSLVDWLQQQARQRNYFTGEDKETLVAIMNVLTDNSISRERAREMSNTDLIEDILVKISLLDEALAMEDEAA